MGVNGIYGLSGSGMDIESLVKVGMMGKQKEYDKMAQKYTKNEWTKTAYLEINNTLTTFKDSTLSQYKMSNTMNAKEASSTNAAVKVSASSSATPMNHTVAVESLSSNAYLISTRKPNTYNNIAANDQSLLLGNRMFQELTFDTDAGTVSGTTLDGKIFTSNLTDRAIEFTLKDGTKNDNGNDNSAVIYLTYDDIRKGATLNDLASQINSKGLNIRASYDTVNDMFSLYNVNGGSENTISIELTSPNVGITNENIVKERQRNWDGSYTDYVKNEAESSSETTYSDVRSSNTAKFFNSWKLYQSKNGDLYKPNTDTLQSDAPNDWLKLGVDEEIDIHTTTRSITYNAWGGEDTESNTTHTHSSIDGTSSRTITGTNGVIKVDGATYTTTDNKVTVNGVTYTALDTTKDSTGAVKNATVSVTQNTDDIIDKVKSFVEDYNKLLSSLYEKYDEKPNSDYKPLTQAQKDAMKEEQIEKWEEKAKKGLLYHDQTLGKIIQNIRSSIVSSVEGVEGKYNSAFSIGISTTGIKGQLKLDEDKLRKALSEDSDAVYNVFAKLDGNDLNNQAKSGIAQRLGDILTTANKSIKSRAGSTSDITEDSDLNKLLRNLQTRMSNFKKMMNSFEDALYKKYDTMEAMLARLGTQLSYVLGGNS